MEIWDIINLYKEMLSYSNRIILSTLKRVFLLTKTKLIYTLRDFVFIHEEVPE